MRISGWQRNRRDGTRAVIVRALVSGEWKVLEVCWDPFDHRVNCFEVQAITPFVQSNCGAKAERPRKRFSANQIRLLEHRPGNVVNLDIGVTGSPRMVSLASALITGQIGVRADNTVAHQSACFGNGDRASKNSTAPLRLSVATSRPSSFSHFSIWPVCGGFPNTPARRLCAAS
jgi:hypothetical protein